MLKELFNCKANERMSGDERREQIIFSAMELFSKNGFKGTTTKQIAQIAGISEAMVFKHFASKDELYKAILEKKLCESPIGMPWENEQGINVAMDARDDKAFFKGIAIKTLTKQQSDPRFMRLMLYSALEEHSIAAAFFKDFITQIYKFIGDYIVLRQNEGAMRGLDPRMAVRALMGMMIHHSMNNILWDKDQNLLKTTNEAAADEFAEILLNGIKQH